MTLLVSGDIIHLYLPDTGVNIMIEYLFKSPYYWEHFVSMEFGNYKAVPDLNK